MAVDALGLIYRLMLRNLDDEKLRREEEKGSIEEKDSEEELRNQELVKALTARRKKEKPKKEKPVKEEPKPEPKKPTKKEEAPKPTEKKPKVEKAPTPKKEPKAPEKVSPKEAPKAPEKVTPKEAPKPAETKAPPVSTAAKVTTGAAVVATVAAGAGIVASALSEAGLSKKAQANVLAQVESESNFKPRSENLNYSSAEAIQKTFGKTRIPSLEFAQQFVNNPEALANHVYAKTDGNSEKGDGWKYRGRGFLQHTGKNQYESIKKYTGIDVVSNPDLLNDPKVAAKAVPWFFLSYKGKKPEQLEDISTVNKSVGFADTDGKKAEKRAELAKKYESGSVSGNTPLPESLSSPSGSKIDQASKENKDLKESLNKDKPKQTTTNNTTVSADNKETKQSTETVDDRPAHLKKKG
jgi:putative chitinase